MGNINPLGCVSNRGWLDRGTTALTQYRPPGPLCGSNPSLDELKQYARHVADSLRRAGNWVDTNRAIRVLLGPQSFTVGVQVGLVKGLVDGAYELVKLLGTLALAEYYDMRHAPTFWERMRASARLMATPLGTGPMVIGEIFGLDEIAAKAHAERQHLFDSLSIIMSQPSLLGTIIKQGTVEKYQAFMGHLKRGTLSGDYQAGVLFGGVLLDVLLVIDGITALVKVAAAIPRVLTAAADLFRLAPRASKGTEEVLAVAAESAVVMPKVPPAPRMPPPVPTKVSTPPKIPPKPKFKPGITESDIINTPKGQRADPATYLDPDYYAAHMKAFEEHGGGFFFTDADIANPNYTSFNPNKFVMSGDDVQSVMTKYKDASGDVSVLEDALGYDSGFLKEKDIYVMKMDNPKVLMPTGNEGGANSLWRPGGLTFPGGNKEAVLDNIPIFHGNDVSNLPGAIKIQ